MGRANDVDSDGGPAGQGNDGYNGPTYADVRALARSIELSSGRRIEFLIGPADPWARYRLAGLQVRCSARTREDPWESAFYGGAIMGGNGGARTLPGAMVQALHGCWAAMEIAGATDESSAQGSASPPEES